MSGLDTFYRSLGVGGGRRNPRHSIRNPKAPYSLTRLQNDLARLPSYHETMGEVNDAIERALLKHGLSLAGYVDQAVPYGQTRLMILPTSDPALYISVQVYRTPNGRYELTTYATRDARRRRSNPRGDTEDQIAFYTMRKLLREVADDLRRYAEVGEVYIPLGPRGRFVVKVGFTTFEKDDPLADLYFWTEHSKKAESEDDYYGEPWTRHDDWKRTSPVFYESLVNLEEDPRHAGDLYEALHHALHHGSLNSFKPNTSRVWPEGKRFRNPSEEEPTEFEVDADVQAGAGEEPPELPPPDLALDRASGIYEEFHGKPSEELVEAEEEIQVRDTLAVLGRLVQIIVEAADESRYSVTFGDDTMLCVSDDGRQLYAVGGDQSLDLEALGISGPASEKDKVFVGSALQVTYRTRKQFDDFAEVDYVHDFGEDGGTLPLLVYDRLNQTVEFAGGDYEIKREGIVN